MKFWLRGSHGLSARRARRTKSSRPGGPKADPKGRNLEVGARRAPRLLVSNKPLYVFLCDRLIAECKCKKTLPLLHFAPREGAFHSGKLRNFVLNMICIVTAPKIPLERDFNIPNGNLHVLYPRKGRCIEIRTNRWM